MKKKYRCKVDKIEVKKVMKPEKTWGREPKIPLDWIHTTLKDANGIPFCGKQFLSKAELELKA